jgi:hypothetical protein
MPCGPSADQHDRDAYWRRCWEVLIGLAGVSLTYPPWRSSRRVVGLALGGSFQGLAAAKPDDPSVEGLQRAVVVWVAVVVGEAGDHPGGSGSRRPRDVAAVSEQEPPHVLGATRCGERAIVGVERVHLDPANAPRAGSPEVMEQFSRAGFTQVDLLTRRCRGRKEDPVEQRVRLGATAEEDADDDGGTLALVWTKCASTSACRPSTACSAGAWKWYCSSS